MRTYFKCFYLLFYCMWVHMWSRDNSVEQVSPSITAGSMAMDRHDDLSSKLSAHILKPWAKSREWTWNGIWLFNSRPVTHLLHKTTPPNLPQTPPQTWNKYSSDRDYWGHSHINYHTWALVKKLTLTRHQQLLLPTEPFHRPQLCCWFVISSGDQT